jgi:hypothetical protein
VRFFQAWINAVTHLVTSFGYPLVTAGSFIGYKVGYNIPSKSAYEPPLKSIPTHCMGMETSPRAGFPEAFCIFRFNSIFMP